VVYGGYKGEHSADSAYNVLYTCWKLGHESNTRAC
jgi:hypothetical protein